MASTMSIEFKTTDVGLIPNDWEVKNIVDNSTMKARIGWQGLTVAEYLNKGDFYLITGTDFKDGKITWDTCHFIDKKRYLQDKNIQINFGDILITKDGTIGKIAFVDRLPLPATLNSGVFVIRPKIDNYIPKYLFYIFESFFFRYFLNKLAAGSTINHLYQKDFVNFNFPLPPTKTEQTAIATTLNDTDTVIQKLEQLLTKKRNIKTGAMQELLKPKVGWKVKKLEEVADIEKGEQLNRETLSEQDSFAVYNGGISPSGFTNKWNTEKETIIISEGGNSCGFVNFIKRRFWRGGHCYQIQPNIEKEFLFHLLKSREKNIMSLRVGSGLPNIQRTRLATFEIYIPKNKSEQIRIAKILSDMDKEIKELEKEIEKYKMLKQGMMQVLLTGKIRLV